MTEITEITESKAAEVCDLEPEVCDPKLSPEGETGVAWGTMYDRIETIQSLIIDGSLDPYEGILMAVLPSETTKEAERARREADARAKRIRYSEAAREHALALVAGGASCRIAAATVLGDARLHTTVWRWARSKGLK